MSDAKTHAPLSAHLMARPMARRLRPVTGCVRTCRSSLAAGDDPVLVRPVSDDSREIVNRSGKFRHRDGVRQKLHRIYTKETLRAESLLLSVSRSAWSASQQRRVMSSSLTFSPYFFFASAFDANLILCASSLFCLLLRAEQLTKTEKASLGGVLHESYGHERLKAYVCVLYDSPCDPLLLPWLG